MPSDLRGQLDDREQQWGPDILVRPEHGKDCNGMHRVLPAIHAVHVFQLGHLVLLVSGWPCVVLLIGLSLMHDKLLIHSDGF